jgi:hypothetical protein
MILAGKLIAQRQSDDLPLKKNDIDTLWTPGLRE